MHPAAALAQAAAVPAVARWLVVATAVAWLVGELRQSANRRPEGVESDRGSRVVLRVATLAGVVGAIILSKYVPAAGIHAAAAPWVGLALLWSGMGLRFWSFRTLGRYFTFTVQTSADQPVITAGPYRAVRHPGYAAILLAVVGVGVLIGNWLSLVALSTAVAAGLAYRIRVEERALLRDLGDAYADYADSRKRLVPFLW